MGTTNINTNCCGVSQDIYTGKYLIEELVQLTAGHATSQKIKGIVFVI